MSANFAVYCPIAPFSKMISDPFRSHILAILGTRPEAIKLAPVIHYFKLQYPEVRVTVCVTAQHRSLLDQVLAWFQVHPDYDLDLMAPNQDLSTLSAAAITGLRDVLIATSPTLVLVQGDTTTAMIGALAAAYQRIPVGHVEAGLRTGDLGNPFPEEINRRVIGATAKLHFAPTPRAASALLAENVSADSVFVTGNTVIDALRLTLRRPLRATIIPNPSGRRFILVTTHRRESFGSPLESICQAIRCLADQNEDLLIVFPVHPNPNVRQVASRILKDHERIQLLEPLRYEAFVHLMARSYLILTDSGGVQEEAPYLAKPTLVLRNNTERPEAVECGAARLVGTDPSRILAEAQSLLDDPAKYNSMAGAGSPFGDGNASRRIVNAILDPARAHRDSFSWKASPAKDQPA